MFRSDRPPAHLVLGELTGLDADGRQRLRSKPSSVRPLLVSRFALVGVSGLVVDQALLWSAVALGHVNYLVGAILATQERQPGRRSGGLPRLGPVSVRAGKVGHSRYA